MKNRILGYLFIISMIFSLSCQSLSNPLQSGGKMGSITDPSQGLVGLQNYRARLTTSFSGTQLGSNSDWSRSMTLTVLKQPATRLLAYSETGMVNSVPAFLAFQGYMGESLYLRNEPSGKCFATFNRSTFNSGNLVEPASFLPLPDKLNVSQGEEQVNGIPSLSYTFQAGDLIADGSPQGSGQVWLAKDGNYITKYLFTLSGDKQVFDADTSGTFTWEYQLEAVDASSTNLLPADCPIPLPQLPSVKDAFNQVTYPGFLSFETSLAPVDVLQFYQANLPGDKFQQVEDISITGEDASMVYSDGSQKLTFSAIRMTNTRVTISGQSAQQAAAVTPQPTRDLSAQATQVYGSPQMRVINSLSLLIGQDPNPSVFSSYHMESHQVSPRWDEQTGSVLTAEEWLSIDVQGKDVHFINKVKSQDGHITSTEVYLIGEKEFDVENGTAVEGLGLNQLTWLMWPLDPIMLLGVGSSKAISSGTDTVSSRSVDVFQLNGTTADDMTGLYSGFGQLYTRLDGNVWVDTLTGALLKAVINYDADIKDTTGTVRGSLPGLLEVTVSQVNAVTVKLP